MHLNLSPSQKVVHAVGVWALLAFLCVVLSRCPLS